MNPQVTGFVFKVQANMDPQHRDRIAFTRICSGKFTRGMKPSSCRTRKPMAIQAPNFFFAQDRSLAEEAYPGDIVGIPNHGTLRIGDTLTEGEKIRFHRHAELRARNPAPHQARRPDEDQEIAQSAQEMAEEGVMQLFRPMTARLRSSASSAPCSSTCWSSGCAANTGLPIAYEETRFQLCRWIDDDPEASNVSPRRTPPRWRATSTARRSSWRPRTSI